MEHELLFDADRYAQRDEVSLAKAAFIESECSRLRALAADLRLLLVGEESSRDDDFSWVGAIRISGYVDILPFR